MSLHTYHLRHARDWPRLCKTLEQLEVPPGGLTVKVEPPRRTNAQNAYLWGVVYPTLAKHLAETRNCQPPTTKQLHYVCKEYFMPRVKVPGSEQTIPMSTTELRKSGEGGFQDYLERIYEFAAKLGCYIPGPNEGE